MSAGGGLPAAPPPLLRSAQRPTGPIRYRRGCSMNACHRSPSPRTAGDRRSEVKEEGRAQPGPGDMSGVGHPSALARADLRAGPHLLVGEHLLWFRRFAEVSKEGVSPQVALNDEAEPDRARLAQRLIEG